MTSLVEVYKSKSALLEGHFLLSSGKHSGYYLQSAKVLEDPKLAQSLLEELAKKIKASNIEIEGVCSPALGGILAGYELARALGVRFIFTERVDGKMSLRRGFSGESGEKFIVCEDIITTGGSAMECRAEIEHLGANVVAFAAIANRGFCARVGSELESKELCKLPSNLPMFALEDFLFETYDPAECPLCKSGGVAYKP